MGVISDNDDAADYAYAALVFFCRSSVSHEAQVEGAELLERMAQGLRIGEFDEMDEFTTVH